jgi:dTDP-4-amino-4,6-dideoxygalactose transaminase
MNDISAAIGLANLELLDEITRKQRENAEYYIKHLKDFLPDIPKDSQPSWWAFYILVNNRDKFMEEMKEAGIETTPMWRRNDEYTCFSEMYDAVGLVNQKPVLPNMDKLEDKMVFIPVGHWLTEEERGYIVERIIRLHTS